MPIVAVISLIGGLLGNGYYLFKQFKSTAFEISFMSVREKYFLSIFLCIHIVIMNIFISSLSLLITSISNKWLSEYIFYWGIICIIAIIALLIAIFKLGKRMDERVNILTNHKNVDNEEMHINMSNLLLKNASLYTSLCLMFTLFITSVFYLANPNSFTISNPGENFVFDDFIVQFDVVLLIFLAVATNVSKLKMLSKTKIPRLMDVKINGVMKYTKVILISNTEEFYFFVSSDGSKEFALSKNQSIEIHRNYESIYKNEEPLKTKNHKSVIKK